jgi:toxin FitB
MPKKTVQQSWQVQTAKARFSELFRRARTEGPQLITKQGKEAVVMIPVEQFEQLTGRARQPKSLVQFFRESPLVGVKLDLTRDKDIGRNIDLWVDFCWTPTASLNWFARVPIAAWWNGRMPPMKHRSIWAFWRWGKFEKAWTRRTRLETWLEVDLKARFHGRILSVDAGIADRWGLLTAEAKRAGKPLPVIDGLLAATALHHNLTVVSRNTGDFASARVPVLNPWNA